MITIYSPEIVVDDRFGDIHGFDHVVDAIDILIAYYLHTDLLIFVTLEIDRCYILVDVFCQYSLHEDYMHIVYSRLHHTQVVNESVTIEVEVRDTSIDVVDFLLKLLKVS